MADGAEHEALLRADALLVGYADTPGAPPVDLRLWTSPEKVVCSISDRGPGIEDPFAGYGPAHGEDLSRGGMGLWLARQLCDHVDIVRRDGVLTVRLVTRLR